MKLLGTYIWQVRHPHGAWTTIRDVGSFTAEGLVERPTPMHLSVALGDNATVIVQGTIQDISVNKPPTIQEIEAEPVVDLADPAALGDDQPTVATYTFGELRAVYGFVNSTNVTANAAKTTISSDTNISGTGVLPIIRIDVGLPLATRNGVDGRVTQTLAVVLKPNGDQKRITFDDPAPQSLALTYARTTDVNTIEVALNDAAGQPLDIDGRSFVVCTVTEDDGSG
nr:hypothetical protein [Nitrosomonas nitrosa]